MKMLLTSQIYHDLQYSQRFIWQFVISKTFYYLLFMNYQVFRQKPDQERRDYYRRMAELRKNKWRTTYRLQNQEQFKFHFFKQEQDVDSQDSKNKKSSKNSIKSEQRIRNRMAAQQSRERHRSYVEELEQKIVQKRGLVCRRCKQELTSEFVKGEMNILCAQETEGCKSKDDNLLESHMNESVIRIDNGGVTTPFGIFFVFCLFSILLAFIPTNGEKPRALFHEQTIIQNPNQKVHQLSQSQFSKPMSFAEFVRSQRRTKMSEQCTSAQERKQESAPLSSFKTFIPQVPNGKQKWTKVGNYFCSKPEIVMQIQPKKKTPYFLLLHTQNKQNLETLKSQDEQNFKIQSSGWKKIQISQCYLGQQ